MLSGCSFDEMKSSRELTSPTSAPAYRPSVAAILQNSAGLVLIGERCDTRQSWQFPQGGVEPGETTLAALARELEEELGLSPGQYSVGPSHGPYRYLFPPGRTKHGFQGQEQHYFLLSLRSPEVDVGFETAVPEFSAVRWIEPANFELDWLPEMKHAVYRQVFLDFFGLHLR
jgi:putative (di)nucleoside polyphosphate hydrolase